MLLSNYTLSWVEVTGWLGVLYFLIVGLTLMWVLSIKKESMSAVAWCLTVLLIPFLGAALFYFFGYQSVHRPIKRKREHANRLRQKQTATGEGPKIPTGVVAPPGWEDIAHLALQLGAGPLVGGNQVELYHSGTTTFEAMLAAIRAAQNHIHMEFFIFRADATGQRFIEAMAERAKAGVEVRFVYDAVGCWGLRSTLLKQLIDAGGRVAPFLTLLNPFRRLIRINLRNHRKILVIDGKVAFTGGINIGDEYATTSPKFGAWRDTHLRVEGPAASWLQRVFIEDWNFATEEDLVSDRYLPKTPAAGKTQVQIAWSGPDQEIKTIREVLFAVIMRAQKRVWIASPYFVPDVGLLDALCLTARTGRDVRVLLPFRPDKWVPFLAGRYYWRDLLAAGGKIYQYTPGFMHAKVIIADDAWCSVGSANFDNRSLFLNFEANCLIESPDIVKQLEAQFLADFAVSIRVDPESFAQRGFISRLAENGCRLLSPVL